MADRVHRELTDADIAKIAGTYHAWREGKDYADVSGFAYSAKHEEVARHDYVLTPGRYVGAEDAEDDGIPFAERFAADGATMLRRTGLLLDSAPVTPVVVPPAAGTWKLRGKGVPHLRRSSRGDLHVMVDVVVPTRPSKRQRELLVAFAQDAGEPVSGGGLREKLGLG